MVAHIALEMTYPIKNSSFYVVGSRGQNIDLEQSYEKGQGGSPSICVLCCSNEDSVDHIFTECKTARKIWSIILQFLDSVDE
jgi:hypothetical protein